MAGDGLLDAAADLLDGLPAELDHMKGVENGDGVGELVVDGVLVAVERVQCRDLDSSPERVAAGLEPVGVSLAGAARDQVEQPRSNVSVLVTGQIDHPGQRPRATTALIDVMPQLLIHAQAGDAV